MSGEFVDKVVIVTGGSGNLGQVVARRFADGGAALVLVDRNQERLDSVAADLKGDTMTAVADLGDAASVDELLANVVARFGRIDILAHTVGGFTAGTPVHDTPQDTWDKMFALNVRPIYITCGRVAKHMLDNGGGKIVMVLARAALEGSANSGAYTASKAAAQRIMQSMALELRDHGINVNGVLPSIIDTPPNREGMPKADYSKWVTTNDVANAIAFLASDDARSLYGVSLEVYGRA
jgi:NAD(P)-dependent dehydrogenase (short-subunit alcohol dehydrogenase family)